MLQERLLGFDVREWNNQADTLWDAARRELFLLRRDVARPLSADRLVWPSVFEPALPQVPPCFGFGAVPVPAYIGPNAGLWEDADAMHAHVRANRAEHKPNAILACTWLSNSGFVEAGPYGPHLEPTRPPAVDPAWQRLGFDVGDGGLLSGLSNCGYLAEEAVTLRPVWRPLLNAYHLFDDPAQAFAFRALADARVPEHAPFFVYGLYVLAIDQGDGLWNT